MEIVRMKEEGKRKIARLFELMINRWRNTEVEKTHQD